MRYTDDVQLVHFHYDQVEPRGRVDAEGAVAAFRNFPFEEQLRQAASLPEPTFPTITFRCEDDGAVLSIWSLELGQYEVYKELAGANVTAEMDDAARVEAAIRDFFAGSRDELFEHLAGTKGAVVRGRGIWGRIRDALRAAFSGRG